jgi:hypothetical protein
LKNTQKFVPLKKYFKRLEEKKMSEIMDIRLQHHLAQEFYRQQMLQRIPGNSSSLKKILNIIDGTHHPR